VLISHAAIEDRVVYILRRDGPRSFDDLIKAVRGRGKQAADDDEILDVLAELELEGEIEMAGDVISFADFVVRECW
jgi:hypothetical protein